MRISDTLKVMMSNFPYMFRDKFDCYSHLFLLVGSGYEWSDGELVRTTPDSLSLKLSENINKIFEYHSTALYRKLGVIASVNDEDGGKNSEFSRFVSKVKDVVSMTLDGIRDEVVAITPDNLERNTETMLSCPLEEKYICNLSKFSNILNIPEDVTDDWKCAINEFYTFIMYSEHEKMVEYRLNNRSLLADIDVSLFRGYVGKSEQREYVIINRIGNYPMSIVFNDVDSAQERIDVCSCRDGLEIRELKPKV